VKRFVEEAGEQAEDDTEALATIRSADALGSNQRTWVRAMAWSAAKVLANLRGGDPRIREALADAKRAKSLLARVLSENAPVLTEETWGAILAERDAEALAWRCALVSMRAEELHASQVRRALLENADLCRYAMTVSRDPRELREVEEMIEKAHAAKGRRT
jgi:hypothetical protein